MPDARWILLGFSLFAALTWLFAEWPRLFIRVFVSREELYRVRRMLRDPHYARNMRIIALLQFAGGLLVAAFATALRFQD
ncbi:MAG TPA: hypothetical protein VHD36_18180 [Pirellulales bacterium]|nr:hypothetical protein [Pirellulales bacterium]